MSPSQQAELERLTSALCDQSLDPPGVERLQTLLATDAECRRTYAHQIALHVLLERKHEQALSPSDGLDEAELPTAMSLLEVAPSSATRAPQRSRFSVGWAAALAASVAIAAGVWWTNTRPERSAAPFIGVLTRATGECRSDGELNVTPARVVAGQRLSVDSGLAEVTLNSGAVVIVRAPADLQLISPMRVRAASGAVRARIGEEAKGFVIETPSTEVVDLGTEFGVDVDRDSSTTDVVVFEGSVNLQCAPDALVNAQPSRMPTTTRETKTLTSGHALRVHRTGATSRIYSVASERFPAEISKFPLVAVPGAIASVTDNIRDPSASVYHQVVRGGLREDCRAYVDRPHEWNGATPAGLPAELVGADYVMTFNNDKFVRDIEITVTLSSPADLYVLFDRRLEPPKWLTERFELTKWKIGLDEGRTYDHIHVSSAVGPGESIDTRHTVWRARFDTAGPVVLGALPKQHPMTSMYGIAAKALIATPIANQSPRDRWRGSQRLVLSDAPALLLFNPPLAPLSSKL